MRRISMATRDELLAAVSERYRGSSRPDKKRIIDEFAAAAGYHRKHAMRVLRAGPAQSKRRHHGRHGVSTEKPSAGR